MTFSVSRASRPLTFLLLLALISLAPLGSHAERVFVGVLEVDSLQGINYGVAAFSRAADLPVIQDQIQAWLADTFFMPSTSGVSASAPLRIVQSFDPAAPASVDNPANVIIIPLDDKGAVMRKAFDSAYTAQKTRDVFTIFEAPADTNRPARVALAIEGRHMFLSASLPALDWAWSNRAKLTAVPPLDLPGTFRVLVNPQRFADLIGTRSEQADAFLDTGRLLRELDSLSISITIEGATAAVSLRGTPKQGTALSALTASLRPSADTLWHAVPANAFFTFLGAFDKPDLWSPFIGKAPSSLLRPVTGHAPQTAFDGEHLSYIVPTRGNKGLCLVQLEPVKDPEIVQQAIRNFHVADATNSVTFKHRGQRQVSGTTVETYGINLAKNAGSPSASSADIGAISRTALSILLKPAVLEAAVANGYLITAIGPEGAIDAHLPPAAFTPKTFTLNRKIGGQDPALNEHLTLGSALRIVDLLRHTVSIMPDIKPEQMRLLPKGGDGATFGICSAGKTLTVSLRIHANEIAALQRLNRDGRAVLQEIVFQILTKQVMEQRPQSSE